MHPTFDPAASLRIWAVETTVGGWLLRIPPLPAADWLPALMSGNTLRLRDLLEDFDLAEAILEEAFTIAELTEGLQFLAESAAGRTIKTAVAIASVAANRWDVIGADAARAGVRFDQIPIAAALDFLYGSVMRHMDEKGQTNFNLILAEVVEPRKGIARNVEPLPASVSQSLMTRPKTVLRRPPDHQDAPSGQPTPQPALPDGNGPVATTGRSRTPGGGVHPRR
jgi:hypothetical protein